MAAVSELVDQNDTKPDRNSESEVTNEDSSDNTIIGSISGNNTANSNSRHDLTNAHPKTAGKNLDSVGKHNEFRTKDKKSLQYVFLVDFSQTGQSHRIRNIQSQKMHLHRQIVRSIRQAPPRRLETPPRKYAIVRGHRPVDY